ncbi:MAG: hypothetical protein ABSH12_03975 [Endomicrobiales bacterium]
MNTHVAIAEAFLTAIRSLPKLEKRLIVERLIADIDKDFTKEEWGKIEKLANKKGKIYNSANEFLKALDRV